MYRKLFTFEQIHFESEMVNGCTVREADFIVQQFAYMQMRLEMPELRKDDIHYFEFDVDWVCGNVWVTEREFEFAGE